MQALEYVHIVRSRTRMRDLTVKFVGYHCNLFCSNIRIIRFSAPDAGHHRITSKLELILVLLWQAGGQLAL